MSPTKRAFTLTAEDLERLDWASKDLLGDATHTVGLDPLRVADTARALRFIRDLELGFLIGVCELKGLTPSQLIQATWTRTRTPMGAWSFVAAIIGDHWPAARRVIMSVGPDNKVWAIESEAPHG